MLQCCCCPCLFRLIFPPKKPQKRVEATSEGRQAGRQAARCMWVFASRSLDLDVFNAWPHASGGIACTLCWHVRPPRHELTKKQSVLSQGRQFIDGRVGVASCDHILLSLLLHQHISDASNVTRSFYVSIDSHHCQLVRKLTLTLFLPTCLIRCTQVEVCRGEGSCSSSPIARWCGACVRACAREYAA